MTAGGKRALVGAGVAVAVGVVAVQFLRAADQTAATTRSNACKALRPDPVPAALQNREAPDFSLADATGKRWSLRSLRGRPVLLNFWATWCPPCAEEMPGMEDLSRKLGDKAIVLAVSVDESWDLIRRFFPRGTPLSIVLDDSKEVPKTYGTEKYPESFLIDADGHVRHYFINTRKWGEPEAVQCIESFL
jgi:peroxiredoxin